MGALADSKDLIYNRFDIIHGDDTDNLRHFCVENEGTDFEIQCYYRNGVADINAWGKQISDSEVKVLIKQIETDNPQICALHFTRTGNSFNGFLAKGRESIINLPSSEDVLMSMMTTKEKSHIRQYVKKLKQEGSLETKIYREDIPEDVVDRFFSFKEITHGTDYGLTPKEYLKKYHVTDAAELVLHTDEADKSLAILFWCRVGGTVYLENLSYNVEYKKCSPGFLVYLDFLKELIKTGCTTVFLGGAGYTYKRKFGSYERECYTGYLLTNFGKKVLKEYLRDNGIEKIALWGGGNLGKSVLKSFEHHGIDVRFLIDRNKDCIDGTDVYSPGDEWPECDCVIITIASTDTEIEEVLNNKKVKYEYYYKLISNIFDAGRS